jgi:adenylate cyclase
MHADVVAFSLHTARDEEATHRHVAALMRTITDISAANGGRVVSTAGDAALVDFVSVVDALKAAILIQQELGGRSEGENKQNPLLIRIGINLGDVIVDNDDIFGDGVNVAQRIQSLAEPGGIAISESVYQQVTSKFDIDFEDRGTHRAKPHDAPFRYYAVLRKRRPRTVYGLPRRWIWPSVVSGGLLVAVAGSVIAFVDLDNFGRAIGWPSVRQPQLSDQLEVVATGSPMVAVLPFEDRSPKPQLDYFSDGVTEDVITSLGRYADVRVLSWNAVSTYKNKSVDISRLSKTLDVRYVVGGSVKRTANSIRINLQLTDASRGQLLWSESLNQELEKLFVVQDEVAQKVASAITARVTDIERQRASRKPTENLDAYDLVLKGRAFLRQQKRGSNYKARALFEQAAKLDPKYSAAYEAQGWTHFFDYLYGWAEHPDRSVNKARDLADKAIAVDSSNARAHTLIAYTFVIEGRYDDAKSAIEIALGINPSSAIAHAVSGQLLLRAGQPENAVEEMEFAIRLDPNPEAFRLFTLSQAYYFLKRYRDVVKLLKRFGSERFAEDPALYAMLAAAQAQLGNLDAAKSLAAKVRTYSPFFNTKRFVEYFAREDQKEHLLEGLNKSGLK